MQLHGFLRRTFWIRYWNCEESKLEKRILVKKILLSAFVIPLQFVGTVVDQISLLMFNFRCSFNVYSDDSIKISFHPHYIQRMLEQSDVPLQSYEVMWRHSTGHHTTLTSPILLPRTKKRRKNQQYPGTDIYSP